MATWPATVARRVRTTPGRLGERRRDATQRHWRIVVVGQLAYCVVIAAWLLHTGNWPTPDQIGIAFFVLAVLMGRGFAFLRDWSPFLLLVLSYEGLRGLADGLVSHTHVAFAPDVDRAMFGGQLPTIWLQQHLWDPAHIHWYDYVAAFMHPMHFIVPLAFAFVLWMRNKRLYWKFVASYLLLSYAGFLTYVLFPAAPPWFASNVGAIPHVDKILEQVLWKNSVSQPVVLVYGYFDANQVAAMPSLHAAFPVMLWLIIWKLRPRWGWLTIAYPLVMDWAVVYMGEHYVIDVIAGTVYGAGAFWAVWVAPEWWRRWRAAHAQDRLVPAPSPGGG